MQLRRIGVAAQHAVDDQVVAQLGRATVGAHAVAYVRQRAARQDDDRVVAREVRARLAQQLRLVGLTWPRLDQAVVEHGVGREVEAAVVGDERRRVALAGRALAPQRAQDRLDLRTREPGERAPGALEVRPHLLGEARDPEVLGERGRERRLADPGRTGDADPQRTGSLSPHGGLLPEAPEPRRARSAARPPWRARACPLRNATHR